MGPRKEAKDSRKICERGVPGNFYLAQPPYIYRVDAFVVYVCYMYVYMYVYIYISRIYTGVCVLNILLCLYICTRKLPPGILESPLP